MLRRIGMVAVLAVGVGLWVADTSSACHRGHGRHHCGHSCGDCGTGCGASACGSSCASACGSPCDGAPLYMPAPAHGTPRKGKGTTRTSAPLVIDEQGGLPLEPGSVSVTLPEGAVLLVDGQPIASTPGTQVFETPALPRGEYYHYTMTMRTTRDGRTTEVARQVTVRGGEQSQVDFTGPTSVVRAD